MDDEQATKLRVEGTRFAAPSGQRRDRILGVDLANAGGDRPVCLRLQYEDGMHGDHRTTARSNHQRRRHNRDCRLGAEHNMLDPLRESLSGVRSVATEGDKKRCAKMDESA